MSPTEKAAINAIGTRRLSGRVARPMSLAREIMDALPTWHNASPNGTWTEVSKGHEPDPTQVRARAAGTERWRMTPNF